jgi:hypothetical protein
MTTHAIILYINSLRLSVTELGSVRPTVVGGAGEGPSQHAARARPGTPHGCDGAQHNSCMDRPSSARHSRSVSRPPWGVPGRVCHRRLTGPGLAPPTAVTQPGIRELCDALPSPGVNPLEGSTMWSCGKLGLGRHSRPPAL